MTICMLKINIIQSNLQYQSKKASEQVVHVNNIIYLTLICSFSSRSSEQTTNYLDGKLIKYGVSRI
jgi:hypothetical protein